MSTRPSGPHAHHARVAAIACALALGACAGAPPPVARYQALPQPPVGAARPGAAEPAERAEKEASADGPTDAQAAQDAPSESHEPSAAPTAGPDAQAASTAAPPAPHTCPCKGGAGAPGAADAAPAPAR